MPVATFVQPDRTNAAQTGTIYPANIDAAISVMANTAAHFAPHQAATPNMTVVVDAGKLGGTEQSPVVVGQQTTVTIVAPTTNPRIDRIVIDSATGVVSVITGTPAASPVAPTVTPGKISIAQVALATTTTTITNSLITDERFLISADGGRVKFPATQNPSADANTLDDYEEGTFTPNLGGNTTYTTQTGIYTKIGRLVAINLYLQINVLGTGSINTISGLPFTAASSAELCSADTGNLATAVVSIGGIVPNGNALVLIEARTAAAVSSTDTLTIFGNSAFIGLSGHYSI